ncbi:MAG: glycine cleavage system protein GcvH [Myxococcales bacterium]|nr:glycine cleavage system protein GcvH [Myxococcales bacterium]
MTYPKEYRYTREHEWARVDEDGTVVVGITDYAQDALGEIVHLELPSEGDFVKKGDTFGVIESTKSVADLFAPVSGRVVEVNDVLVDSLEVLGEDPYEEGWMVRIRPTDSDELDELMDASEYEELVGELEE